MKKVKILPICLFSFISLGLVSCADADFAKKGTVSLANNGVFEHGKISLSQSGLLSLGTKVTITAIPDENYVLDNLYLNNVVLEGFEFSVVEGDNIVSATFIEDKKTVDENKGVVSLENNGVFEHGSISLSQSGTLDIGTIVTITVTPDENYTLDNLYLNNVVLESFEFSVVQGDNIVSATFIEEPTVFEIPEGLLTPGQNGVATINYDLKEADEYFASIDFSYDNENLKEDLRLLVSDYTSLTYGDARYMLAYTDESIETPGKILGIYDSSLLGPNWDYGNTWNREHVWCRNHLKIDGTKPGTNNSNKGITADLHNLKPCSSSVNSSRGDDFFGEKNESGTYYPNYKGDIDYRGDVARICFYMALRYDGLILSENPSATTNLSIAKLSTLLKWNKEDPVDVFEARRNERIYLYQGNRNPFIDYPLTLAERIFNS